MATFKIHVDAEKENPQMPQPLREKTFTTLVGGGGGGVNVDQRKINAFQPKAPLDTVNTGTVFGKNVGGNRGNFVTLNNPKNNKNENGVLRMGTGVAGGTKMAFREVSNVVKANETVGFSAGSTNLNVNAVQSALGAKKTTVVPVVEQFRSFSVYEDKIGNQQHHIAATITENITTKIEIDKENINTQQKHEKHLDIDVKRTASLDDSNITNANYTIDGTPMSISDVLSPMSVDRSQMEKPIIDGSIGVGDFAGITKTQVLPLPRNDRQRFYEVIDYQRDILQYFRESEQKHRPKPHYMQRQTDINHTMRTILVDWLVEVSEEYNLDTETLYLAVFYIDRFLSHMSVVRSKLQLVGTAAMYIASKYEEIYPPDVSEFVFITDDTYTKSQVLRMEQIILKILNFDLCTPTANVYINSFAVIVDMPEMVKIMAHYISELSLLEADPFLRYLPSKISAGSVALARLILEYPIWSPELQDCTTYSLEDLTEVILHLAKVHGIARNMAQQAIPEKYKSDKYKQVSIIKPVELNEELLNEIVNQYNKLMATNADNETNENIGENNATTTTNSQNVRKMISLMFN